jgi:hypothetical protein
MPSVEVLTQPLTVEYIDLLKMHGDPEAEEIRDFLHQHRDDRVFQMRSQVLNRVFLIDLLVPQNAAKAM